MFIDLRRQKRAWLKFNRNFGLRGILRYTFIKFGSPSSAIYVYRLSKGMMSMIALIIKTILSSKLEFIMRLTLSCFTCCQV